MKTVTSYAFWLEINKSQINISVLSLFNSPLLSVFYYFVPFEFFHLRLLRDEKSGYGQS